MAFEGNSHQDLEKTLELSKSLYETLILTSQDGISVVNLEGNFTFVSPQTIKLHGFEFEDELINTSFLNLIDVSHHDEILAGIESTKGKGSLKEVEYKFIRKDGSTFQAELNVSTLLDSKGNPVGYISAIRDITDRKKLEERLRQSYKMEALGLLAGKFAHDFNNFLQVIRGYSEIITNEIDIPENIVEYFQEIKSAESKAEFLVEQLLAFGRRQILKLSNININTLIDDMNKTIKTTVGENINLEFDLEKDIYTIRIDQVQLTQVIINILFNARDAIKDVGAIKLKTRNVCFDEKHINFQENFNKGDYVEISISDSGDGIPEHIRDKVFQPFFTTKEMGKGTGLGLASVYGIIKQSNGYIFFDSELNKGTTFRVYIPKIDAMPDSKILLEDQTNSNLMGDERILLVEDDDAVRIFIETTLRKYGYKVRSAIDGHEALSKLHGTNKINLLITDVVLPNMNGRQVAKKILEKSKDCKVLYISSYNDNVVTNHGVLEEGINFLRKPFTTKEFLEKIREILN